MCVRASCTPHTSLILRPVIALAEGQPHEVRAPLMNRETALTTINSNGTRAPVGALAPPTATSTSKPGGAPTNCPMSWYPGRSHFPGPELHRSRPPITEPGWEEPTGLKMDPLSISTRMHGNRPRCLRGWMRNTHPDKPGSESSDSPRGQHNGTHESPNTSRNVRPG
jgi:hypothetical protein